MSGHLKITCKHNTGGVHLKSTRRTPEIGKQLFNKHFNQPFNYGLSVYKTANIFTKHVKINTFL